MDKGLSRLNQSRRDKLPVVIPKGRIRPVSPLTAARFATECNNAIKNHVLCVRTGVSTRGTLSSSLTITTEFR